MPIRVPIRMPICVRAFSLITLLLGAAACGEPGSSVATLSQVVAGTYSGTDSAGGLLWTIQQTGQAVSGTGSFLATGSNTPGRVPAARHLHGRRARAAPARRAGGFAGGLRVVQRPFRSGAVRGRGVLGIAERILGGALRTPDDVPYQLVLIGGVPHPAGQ